MRPRDGLLFLIPVALFVVGVFVFAFSQAEPTRPPALNPLKDHAPCYQLVQGMTPEWTCSDQSVWVYQNGHWQNAGQITALPKIPLN